VLDELPGAVGSTAMERGRRVLVEREDDHAEDLAFASDGIIRIWCGNIRIWCGNTAQVTYG